MSLKSNLHNLKEKYKGTKMAPAFNAIHTFLYLPNEVTHNGTHIKAADDLKRTMNTVIMALIPCLLFGMFNAGYQHYAAIDAAKGISTEFSLLGSFITWDNFWIGIIKVLPLVVVSYGVGLLVEFIFAVIKGHEVEEGYLVTGMLVPLIVPIDTPLWMLSVAVVFGVVIGKEVFGGTGMNILNPALTARAFLFFAYPTKMSGNSVWIANSGEISQQVDGFTGATALGDLASTVGVDKGSDAVAGVMTQFGSEGTYSMMNSFLGFIPGSIGETSALACLLGAALLIFTGIGSWKIMLSMLIGGLSMGWIFNLAGSNAFMDVNPVHQLLIGGFMFGMVFMATDPVSAAQTETGKWIYGFFAGFLGIMIRVFNPAYPEGIMMAILFMNVMAPLIDHYVIQSNISRRQKRLIAQTA